MVLYEFPPLGGIGMSRNVRNVQYLPRHAWTPVVVTPGDAHAERVDADSLRLVPDGVAIVRTRLVGPQDLHRAAAVVRTASRRSRRWAVAIRRLLGAPPQPRGQAEAAPGLEETRAYTRPASPDLALRIRRFLLFPDDAVGWVPFAIAGAMAARRLFPCDAIFSTSYPVSSHLVAGVVKCLTGLPWVAELRDPTPAPPDHHGRETEVGRRGVDREVGCHAEQQGEFQARISRPVNGTDEHPVQ
jgi:hypothetical protein